MSSHSLESLDDAPSISDDGSYDSDAEELKLAQQEWEESIHQLQLLLTLLVMPLLGKWLGRRWSQWGVYSIVIIAQCVAQDS